MTSINELRQQLQKGKRERMKKMWGHGFFVQGPPIYVTALLIRFNSKLTPNQITTIMLFISMVGVGIMLIPGYMEKFGRLGLGSAATYMISSGKLKVEDTAKILMFFSLSVGFLPLLLLPVYYQHFLSYFLDNKNVAMLTVAFLLLSMPGVFINNYFSNVTTYVTLV